MTEGSEEMQTSNSTLFHADDRPLLPLARFCNRAPAPWRTTKSASVRGAGTKAFSTGSIVAELAKVLPAGNAE
jgi:hypothetical protein